MKNSIMKFSYRILEELISPSQAISYNHKGSQTIGLENMNSSFYIEKKSPRLDKKNLHKIITYELVDSYNSSNKPQLDTPRTFNNNLKNSNFNDNLNIGQGKTCNLFKVKSYMSAYPTFYEKKFIDDSEPVIDDMDYPSKLDIDKKQTDPSLVNNNGLGSNLVQVPQLSSSKSNNHFQSLKSNNNLSSISINKDKSLEKNDMSDIRSKINLNILSSEIDKSNRLLSHSISGIQPLPSISGSEMRSQKSPSKIESIEKSEMNKDKKISDPLDYCNPILYSIKTNSHGQSISSKREFCDFCFIQVADPQHIFVLSKLKFCLSCYKLASVRLPPKILQYECVFCQHIETFFIVIKYNIHPIEINDNSRKVLFFENSNIKKIFDYLFQDNF